MNVQLAIIILYAAGLAIVGALISRRVTSSSSFLVADRSLSPRLLFATLLAANIGAGSTVGAAGLGYQFGLSAWWWVGSAGLGQLILAFTLGPKIWKLAKLERFYTLGDFLEHRYNRRVRGIVAVLIWFGSLAILAAQLMGISWILNVVTGVSKPVGCLIGGLCVTVYFSAGGLLSAAWVNTVQLGVKLIGFSLALPLTWVAIGGWKGMATAGLSKSAGEGFLSVTGIGFSGILSYLVLLVPSFIVSPGLIQKIYGARDANAARKGTAFNGIALLLFSFVPVILGMAAAVSFPGLAEPEMAMPLVLKQLLPVWVGALALAAIFSAEVSSADAVLFMLTSSLGKDLYKGFLKPEATERQLLRVTRGASILSGCLGVVLAVFLPSIISALKIFYGLVTVSLFVPVVAGLYTSHPTASRAVSAIVTSVVLTLLFHLTLPQPSLWGLSPEGWGLLVSAGIFLTWSRRSS